MPKKLDVYFKMERIGELEQNNHGQMRFTYVSEWLENPAAFAVSQSLPLQAETFTQKECRPFFAGILPEDTIRKLVARNLGISANNDFSMLEKIGGECAGALTFLPKDEQIVTSANQYKELSKQDLIVLLEKLVSQPLLAGEKNVRLSMAGVQDKLPVAVQNGRISIPLSNSPSTHILKPTNERFKDLHYNEIFCMSLARKIGLQVAKIELKNISGIEFLLIERYDRIIENDEIVRLHQEDFCQAIGIVPEQKYQNEGGPSLKSCFELIRRASTIPALDLERLIKAVIFNLLIGNCDAHGKNFSLLYQKEGITLSPLYDLINTLYYENLTTKMAMKIGKEYDANKIDQRQFEMLAEQISFSKPGIHKLVAVTADKVLSTLSKMPIQNEVEASISTIIKKRCKRFC